MLSICVVYCLLEGDFCVVLGFPHIGQFFDQLFFLMLEHLMFYSESRQKLVEDCGVIEVMVAAVDVVIDEGEEVVEELFALVD